MILNNYFDITKPILESLFEEAKSHDGILDDIVFTQCCHEYNVDEEEIMDQMFNSEEYNFKRYSTGWTVKSIK